MTGTRWAAVRRAGALALAVLVATACSGGQRGSASRLAPARVPAGLSLCLVSDLRTEPLPDPRGEASSAAIWGDRSLSDPWAGRLVGMSSERTDAVPVHDQARPVTVHGVPGYVAAMQLFQAISSAQWGQVVTWGDPSGLVIEVAVRGTDADEAVRIAELVTMVDGAPVLPGDALGRQTAIIYDEVPIAPYGGPLGEKGTGTLFYRSAEDPGGHSRSVTISGLARPASDMQPMRFLALTAEATSIRGHDGLVYAAFDRDHGPFGVIWEEAPGLIVQVVGLGLDRTSVLDVAESLEPVSAAGWETLKRQAETAHCFPH